MGGYAILLILSLLSGATNALLREVPQPSTHIRGIFSNAGPFFAAVPDELRRTARLLSAPFPSKVAESATSTSSAGSASDQATGTEDSEGGNASTPSFGGGGDGDTNEGEQTTVAVGGPSGADADSDGVNEDVAVGEPNGDTSGDVDSDGVIGGNAAGGGGGDGTFLGGPGAFGGESGTVGGNPASSNQGGEQVSVNQACQNFESYVESYFSDIGSFTCSCTGETSATLDMNCRANYVYCDHRSCGFLIVEVQAIEQSPVRASLCVDYTSGEVGQGCLDSYYCADGDNLCSCAFRWDDESCQRCAICAGQATFTGDCSNVKGPSYVQEQCTDPEEDITFFETPNSAWFVGPILFSFVAILVSTFALLMA